MCDEEKRCSSCGHYEVNHIRAAPRHCAHAECSCQGPEPDEQAATIARLQERSKRLDTTEKTLRWAQNDLAQRDATIDSLRRSLDHLGPAVLVIEQHVKERDETIARLREHARAVRNWYPNTIEEGQYLTGSAANALNALRALAEEPS
jgi:septal ring factor EnvC (AmiA/AmiB activator)